MNTDVEVPEKSAANVADMLIPDTVNTIFSDNAVWLIPLFLVLIQFFFKLFVGERASFPQVWKSILQSPVDVGFLALSFAGTVLITTPNTAGVFATSLLFIILLVISVVIWKYSPHHTNSSSVLISSFLVILNFIITGSMLVYSISMMLRT